MTRLAGKKPGVTLTSIPRTRVAFKTEGREKSSNIEDRRGEPLTPAMTKGPRNGRSIQSRFPSRFPSK